MEPYHNILLINRHFSDLNPIVAGWEKCACGHSFGPYARDYYLIHYVVSGKGTLYTAQGSFSVERKNLFIIRPHEVTTYTADQKDPWYYIWIGFDGAVAKRLETLPPVLPYFENTFLQLLQCKDNFEQKELFIVAKLFELFSEIFTNTQKTPKYEKLAADYISANYMREIRIESVAAQLGINRQYLSRLFKSAYGMSMQHFLVQTRLQHAARFLRGGSSVAQAAYLCGYEDVFNFSRMFKKEYGVSPQFYKNRN